MSRSGSKAEIRFGKWAPDMALYHSDNTHYDLLVKDDSRIALLGLLAVESSKENKPAHAVDEEWISVSKKKMKHGEVEVEKLLKDDHTDKNENHGDESNCDKDLVEEIVLMKAKKNGFRRTGPQDTPTPSSKEPLTHKCMKCKFEFQSNGILEAHLKTHKESFICEICSQSFENKESVEEHILNDHSSKQTEDQWNCDSCAFQANCATELMKHLKITGHQPSKHVKDKRKLFEDYKQCYTCKMDFDGYYNLMDHRKNVHPSNKKCRNYLKGECPFGEKCWYVHEEKSNNESIFESFKCDLCKNNFKGRTNFMKHKKLIHPEYVSSCEKFRTGNCKRSEKDCWFLHTAIAKGAKGDLTWSKVVSNSPAVTKTPGFHSATAQAVPPENLKMMMDMVSNLCNKLNKMEKRLEDLMIN